MSTAIAFLSGKGGSGKTTLALSTAHLLCKCGVHTLLVDCDLSTNGATYFYESQLVTSDGEGRFEVRSFDSVVKMFDSDLVEDGLINVMFPLTVESGLDFLPSISDISGQYPKEQEKIYDHALSTRLEGFLAWARKNYEIILFDCQAGYAEFMPALLPLMDADLFVLETDSISASAMRSLHLKIGKSFGHARLYQVFNKATPEEFDIYSKIIGTFFTNIGTLLFDWKIRQAFSRSQVPDLEHTSAKYGLDLCEICKIIIADKAAREKLSHFSRQLLGHCLKEEHEQLEEKLYSLAGSSTEKSVSTRIIVIALISYILIIFLLSMGMISGKLENSAFPAVLAAVISVPIIGIFMQSLSRPPRAEQRGYKRRLKEIEKELERLSDN